MHGNEMRRVLSDEIYKLRSGKSKPDRANAISRAASQITQSIRVELIYCQMTGQIPSIQFASIRKALAAPKNSKQAKGLRDHK